MTMNWDWSLLSHNMRGFKNGFDALQDILSSNSIVAVQEHWLHPDNLAELNLLDDNYDVFSVSHMSKASQHAIIAGRPCGTVAFLWPKSLI